MKTLWLDPFSGLSGDMLVGLLIDLGADLSVIKRELAKLPVGGYDLFAAVEKRGGIGGSKFHVELLESQPSRNWLDIDRLLEKSTLSTAVVDKSRAIFRRLAEAEGRVHQTPMERVHFHEVGAVDSIVDIVAVTIALEQLQIEKIVSAPLPMTRGQVETEHGLMPLPAPATLELMTGLLVTADERPFELVTPTGAAVVAELATFAGMPEMVVEKVGYGVGSRDKPGLPNLLRGVLGDVGEKQLTADQVAVLESHIDDANPEWLGALMDRLFAAGALDVVWQSVMMKKGRPGLRLTVVAKPGDEESLSALIMRESSSIGVRWHRLDRFVRQRESIALDSPFGVVEAKRLFGDGLPERLLPEYENCKEIAEQNGWSLPDTYRRVESYLLSHLESSELEK